MTNPHKHKFRVAYALLALVVVAVIAGSMLVVLSIESTAPKHYQSAINYVARAEQQMLPCLVSVEGAGSAVLVTDFNDTLSVKAEWPFLKTVLSSQTAQVRTALEGLYADDFCSQLAASRGPDLGYIAKLVYVKLTSRQRAELVRLQAKIAPGLIAWARAASAG